MFTGRWGIARIALATAISLLVLIGPAHAADPSTNLSEAESRIAGAEVEVASAEAELDAARSRLEKASRRARPATAAAVGARAQARQLRASIASRQQRARAQIQALEATHRQEADDRDRAVTNGIGFGLAALIAAGIALSWGWFRASAGVAALSRIDLGRALGLCLGGGLLVLIVGGALIGADGLPGAVGALLVGVGFVLPTAFLLGRHSAEIQRGRAKPLSKRSRLPRWISYTVAALLLLIALSGLASPLTKDPLTAFSPSPQLKADSHALEAGPDARQLDEAIANADAAEEQAAEPAVELRIARAALSRASGTLRNAKGVLVRAEADQRRFARQLAVLVAREEREVAREAVRAERETEELEEEESSSSGCDPNYSGCVPVYPPDVNCPEVGETVTVLGSDPHGLDADGDLVGCE